jgi:hypothetical protein
MIAFAWNKNVVIPTCFKWESSARFIQISGFPTSWKPNDVVPHSGTSIQCLRLGMYFPIFAQHHLLTFFAEGF